MILKRERERENSKLMHAKNAVTGVLTHFKIKKMPCQFLFFFFFFAICKKMTILSGLGKVQHKRFFSSTLVKGAKQAKNPYTNTILLPKTPFPLRADAVNREHLFHDRCTKELYSWQVQKKKRERERRRDIEDKNQCIVEKQHQRHVCSSRRTPLC
jgi:hypothetical protein